MERDKVQQLRKNGVIPKKSSAYFIAIFIIHFYGPYNTQYVFSVILGLIFCSLKVSILLSYVAYQSIPGTSNFWLHVKCTAATILSIMPKNSKDYRTPPPQKSVILQM